MIPRKCSNIFDRAICLSQISAGGNHFFIDDGLIDSCSGFTFEYGIQMSDTQTDMFTDFFQADRMPDVILNIIIYDLDYILTGISSDRRECMCRIILTGIRQQSAEQLGKRQSNQINNLFPASCFLFNGLHNDLLNDIFKGAKTIQIIAVIIYRVMEQRKVMFGASVVF